MDNNRKLRVIERMQLWCRALETFVEIQTLHEEDVLDVLNEVDFTDLNFDEYKMVVVSCWPGVGHRVASLTKAKKKKVIDEIWPHLLEANPSLAPESIIKHEIMEEEPVDQAAEAAPPKQTITQEKRERPTKKEQLPIIREMMNELRRHLEANVVGQRTAIDEVVRAIGRCMLRKEREERPVATFFFAGPTGVGKTELARQIAVVLGGKEDRLVQVNCGEYTESHTAQRLIGAPPGYIGHERGGVLESKIKQDGTIQVILFDEFEKAHPRLQSLLLSAMEDGYIDTGNNKKVYLSECVIILTSNVGVAASNKNHIGFQDSTASDKKSVMRRAVEKFLPAEFVNRLTEIIIFDVLTEEQFELIATLRLKEVKRRLDHLIDLDWTPEAVSLLAKAPDRAKFGARRIRKVAERLEADICQELLRTDMKRVRVDAIAGKLVFEEVQDEVQEDGAPA